ncbi:LysM peptidoglycan-binding domain-containing protein [Skermania piniformis]|uniref:LysM peptidoglycan-binding domain-containing protein n=1 Tax=Skermania pinensis TaxID=39122 RepID=A0ABX8SFJ4_9ACTN|nr:LysM peptidoglycan-binding domain-containing protein [Skermania piniformis]QXQ15195.1 LysM peptidoglycan-binding domain-containing protein [Skermania piniformis]
MSTYVVQSGDALWRLAERFYGDGRRWRVIAAASGITDGDQLEPGQEIEIPYVTYRYRVRAGDTKAELAQRFYQDPTSTLLFEIPNGAAQRDLLAGEMLLIPDFGGTDHHTMVAGETLPQLAEYRWGVAAFWPIISAVNHLPDGDPAPGTVLTLPRLNRRRRVVVGDTLWRLVADNYGDYDNARTQVLVQMVAAANLIDDPSLITVGQTILFPSFSSGPAVEPFPEL